MPYNKFKTYKRLSYLSGVAMVSMTPVLYIIDCIMMGRLYSASIIARTLLPVICLFLYLFYKRSDGYRDKSLILGLIPHIAFESSLISHLMIHNGVTFVSYAMFLIAAFLMSSIVLDRHTFLISSAILGAEAALSLTIAPIRCIVPSAMLMYSELLAVTIIGCYIDNDYRKQYAAEVRLKNISITDSLTECFNRKKLADLIVAGTNRLNCTYPVSMLMLDIDHFKNVNDTFGHEMGDEVLKYVALTAKDCIREADYIIRWGGEEFVILLVNVRLKEASVVAERIRAAIQKEHKNSVNHDIPVTVSIGVTEYDDESFDLSLKRADEMMYKAKTTGRNRVVCDE